MCAIPKCRKNARNVAFSVDEPYETIRVCDSAQHRSEARRAIRGETTFQSITAWVAENFPRSERGPECERDICVDFNMVGMYGTDATIDSAMQQIALNVLLGGAPVDSMQWIDEGGEMHEIDLTRARSLAGASS